MLAWGLAWATGQDAWARPAVQSVDLPIVHSGSGRIPTVHTDLDGDDLPDSITTIADGTQIRVDVFLSRTATHSHYHFASTDRNLTLVACDVTHDGACDLVFSREQDRHPIALLVNRGDGTFDVHPCDGHLHQGSIADFPPPDSSPVALVPPSGNFGKLGALAPGPRQFAFRHGPGTPILHSPRCVAAGPLHSDQDRARAPPAS